MITTADCGASERLGPYLAAALAGDRRRALGVTLGALADGWAIPDVYLDLLQPAQYEIGSRWERNVISVAQEHLATAVTQFVVASLYERLPVPAVQRGRAVVTGVLNELHQLGANMISDVLESDGWGVRFLGTQLPHDDILRAIDEHEPTLIGISTTLLPNLRHAGVLIEAVRRRTGSGTRIIVGGGAFRADPEVWRSLGADAVGGDLREARDAVRRLFPE